MFLLLWNAAKAAFGEQNKMKVYSKVYKNYGDPALPAALKEYHVSVNWYINPFKNTTNRPSGAVGVEEINGLVQNAKGLVYEMPDGSWYEWECYTKETSASITNMAKPLSDANTFLGLTSLNK